MKVRQRAAESVETVPYGKGAVDDHTKEHRVQDSSKRDRVAVRRLAAHRRSFRMPRIASVTPPMSVAAATP
jgi:hypothetical protein